MLSCLFFAEQTKENAGECSNRSDRLRGEKTPQGGRAVYIIEADDPSGHAGAEDRTENHTGSLLEIHHPGVDKADSHHGCRAGGLQHTRDADAERYGSGRGARKLVQNRRETALRDLVQSVAHQLHSKQKQRYAREKLEKLRYVHRKTAPFEYCVPITGKPETTNN